MPEPSAIAIMSVGRLGFTATFNCALIGMSGAGVAMDVCSNLFWEQDIQNGISERVAAGEYDYIITVDHDGLFTSRDVTGLLELMANHPEADAICAVQTQRQRDAVIVLELGQPAGGIKEADYSGELTQIRSGHLGLTVFRSERFRELPKPWFMAVPSSKGEWDEWRQGPDIYFWTKWDQYKFTLYQANRIRIGHLALVANWPGKDFKLVRQYLTDYRDNGKPKEVQELCR